MAQAIKDNIPDGGRIKWINALSFLDRQSDHLRFIETPRQGTGGPSLPTSTTRTSVADQVPDPPLAAVDVTQTAGQVSHQLVSTLTAPVAQLA